MTSAFCSIGEFIKDRMRGFINMKLFVYIEQSKVMGNIKSNNTFSLIIVEKASSVKYLRETLQNDDNGNAEIASEIANSTPAMTKLEKIWKRNIIFHTKFKLYKSLIVAILFIRVRYLETHG